MFKKLLALISVIPFIAIAIMFSAINPKEVNDPVDKNPVRANIDVGRNKADQAKMDKAVAEYLADKNLICDGCNVLFIVVDTLAADHMSLYGYGRETTPYLEEFAEQATTFNNHYAQVPFTPPSHMSIFTGLYPITHQTAFNAGEDDKRKNIRENSDAMPVLPIILEENGYKTAAFVSTGRVGMLESGFQSFELFSERPMPSKDAPKVNTRNLNSPKTGFYETNNNAMNWLDENSQEKFFLWVHYWDVHYPYEPIPEYDIFNVPGSEKDLKVQAAKYDGEIVFVDHKINILLNKLKELNIEDETIVLITSDHGESFGEYSCEIFSGKNEKCIKHPKSLFDPETHVPLIIKVPGAENEVSRRIDEVTESVDIAPTILDLLAIDYEEKPDYPIEGSSLAPLLAGLNRPENFAFSALGFHAMKGEENYDFTASLRAGQWKLVSIPSDTDDKQELYLFNKENGALWEAVDIASSEEVIVKDLEIKLQEIIDGEELVYPEPDAETRELLMSLGYME